MDQVPGQPSSGSEEVEKQKTRDNIIKLGGHDPVSASSRTQQLLPHSSSCKDARIGGTTSAIDAG